MIMRNPYTGGFSVEREVIELGSKYKGKPGIFFDEINGTYWEVLPTMKHDCFRLQKGILKKLKAKPDNLPNIKRKFPGGAIGNWSRRFWRWA